MDSLKVKNFGPIAEADVEFGDLTILVGPQASGKSIFLQLLKLTQDTNNIASVLHNYGYVWNNAEDFMQLYFGEGMQGIWDISTSVLFNDREVPKDNFALGLGNFESNSAEKLFYIPAQRVFTLESGWPKPFSDFGNDPFVLKNFSENLRLFMDKGPGPALVSVIKNSFPQNIDSTYRRIFYDGEIELDTTDLRKRFMLKVKNSKLPYMAWSTGQKEFMPLWLSFFFILNPIYKLNAHDKFVIIEEPEMGLHPRAIESLLMSVLEFLSVGYRVVISTHSPILLEFSWAMRLLKDSNAPSRALLELFSMTEGTSLDRTFETIMSEKTFKTYYFNNRNRTGTIVKNISALDAFSDDPDVSEWGGLTSFASRASEIVAKNIPL